MAIVGATRHAPRPSPSVRLPPVRMRWVGLGLGLCRLTDDGACRGQDEAEQNGDEAAACGLRNEGIHLGHG